MKKVLLSVMVLCLGFAGIASADQGKVLYRYWGNIPGTAIADLEGAVDATDPNIVRYPDHPDWTRLLDLFEAPLDHAADFGAELSGWIIPAQTGSYKFWIASDDAGELWLSTNLEPANATRIAWVNGWTGSRAFERLNDDGTRAEPAQGPATVSLEAGKAYYIMARYKEGGGGDNCAVAWQGPGMAAWQVIGENDPAVIRSNDPRLSSNPTPDGLTPAALDSTLSWLLPMASYVPAPVLDVYWGTSPEAMTKVIAGAAAPTSYDPGPLTYDTTYYWRVDTLNAPDPNSGALVPLQGTLWSFATETQKAVITMQPQNAKVGEGCAGIFTVAAISGVNEDGGPLSYQWKKADGTALAGETSDTLIIGEAGSYYCTVSNAQGGADSDAAALVIATRGAAALNRDIGTPVAGSFTVNDDGVYRVTGNGNDIWGGSDNFHFVYTPVEGDCEISARVVNIENPSGTGDGWVKAGVMIRDELVGNSLHGFMAVTTGNGSAWQGRKLLGDNCGNSSGHDGGGQPTPRWVKVVRQGNQFYGYTSADGTNWNLIAGNAEISNPQTFAMAGPVYIGLAVTSHNGSNLATGVFDNVNCFGISWKISNPAPQNLETWTPEDWVNPDADVVLSWDAAKYGPCGATYNVAWSLDAADLADPNVAPNYVVTDTTATIPAADIDYEQVIYWRVDVYYGGEREIGDVWSFETVKLVPVITRQPVDASGHIGDAVSLSIAATSLPAKPISDYSWYKVGVDADQLVASGPSLTTLELTVSEATKGTYYCVVGNPDPKFSNTARVTIHRLVAHYPLDAIGVTGDAELIEDISGEMRHGIKKGDVTVVPGMVGNAFSFAGQGPRTVEEVFIPGDHIELGRWDPSEGTGQLSVAHWIAWNPEGGSNWQGTIGKRDNWNESQMKWQIELNKNAATFGLTEFKRAGGGTDTLSAKYTMPQDLSWVHMIVTFNGSTATMYINGEPIGTGAFSFFGNHDPASMLTIGACQVDGGNPWKGMIDDVYIYNYALTPVEASSIYANATGETVCAEWPTWDLNGDCKVDLKDFAILAADWLECNMIPCDRW
ncbi:MAG: hypothetical protein IH624_04215 [Phycisphaerae bacterium]|nr:hypothetical protein [Phycisphaerae bacterium]